MFQNQSQSTKQNKLKGFFFYLFVTVCLGIIEKSRKKKVIHIVMKTWLNKQNNQMNANK